MLALGRFLFLFILSVTLVACNGSSSSVPRDTTAPVIILAGDNPQTIEAGETYMELGATASDNHDGDLSAVIIIDASTVDTAVPGDYTVSYDVSDSAGNAAVTVTRTVLVRDTIPPVITLLGADPQVIEAGSAYVELGANASDNLDGDLNNSVAIDASQVSTQSPGSYVVIYTVNDAAGNTGTASRTVVIQDTTPPVIMLLGDNPQIIVAGNDYIELGATASDSLDGDLTAVISIDVHQVDTSQTGIYDVGYRVADSSGNLSDAERTVRVLATGEWRLTGDMHRSRSGHNAVLMPDGRVLVTGGMTEVYDPHTGLFEVLTAINEQPFGEGHTSTVLADGRVLIAGGGDYYGTDKAYVFSLPPSLRPVGPMSVRRTEHTATLLDDGRVLIVGGRGSVNLPGGGAEVRSHANFEIFDPVSGTFSATGPLYEARTGHTATLLHNGSVLVVAGWNYDSGVLVSTEIYDPDTGAFRASARVPGDGRRDHTATLLPDGDVLVVGGHNELSEYWPEEFQRSVIFDVAAESFLHTGDMVVPRGAHVAAVLHSSSSDCIAPVLIAGGYLGWKEATNSVELFDPLLGMFYELPDMLITRGWPAGTVLADGRVLVTGGSSYFIYAGSNAEVFEVIGGCP